MNIVWFKRDLRIVDHVPLVEALKLGPVIPLYIIEPELWQQPDMSYRHYLFLQDSLLDLNECLKKLGQKLIIRIGNVTDIFNDISQRHKINSLWSHQETWNDWTYTRDKKIKSWCKFNNIPWYEPPQNGVIRCLNNRNGWSGRWYNYMNRPLLRIPSIIKVIDENSQDMPSPKDLGLKVEHGKNVQKGGRQKGLELLNSFLYERGEFYTTEMSSPLTAFNSCSRLSAHLAFGTLSMREVFQACEKRNREINQKPFKEKGKWPNALRSLSARLRWHCHFIQKLEDEPRIEFENMHPVYNGLREITSMKFILMLGKMA
jgi:deoxyribodipyrimidine photo-lyase